MKMKSSKSCMQQRNSRGLYFALQLFSRAAAQQLYSNQRLQRWCFDVELVYLAQQLKVQRRACVAFPILPC